MNIEIDRIFLKVLGFLKRSLMMSWAEPWHRGWVLNWMNLIKFDYSREGKRALPPPFKLFTEAVFAGSALKRFSIPGLTDGGFFPIYKFLMAFFIHCHKGALCLKADLTSHDHQNLERKTCFSFPGFHAVENQQFTGMDRLVEDSF